MIVLTELFFQSTNQNYPDFSVHSNVPLVLKNRKSTEQIETTNNNISRTTITTLSDDVHIDNYFQSFSPEQREQQIVLFNPTSFSNPVVIKKHLLLSKINELEHRIHNCRRLICN